MLLSLCFRFIITHLNSSNDVLNEDSFLCYVKLIFACVNRYLLSRATQPLWPCEMCVRVNPAKLCWCWYFPAQQCGFVLHSSRRFSPTDAVTAPEAVSIAACPKL